MVFPNPDTQFQPGVSGNPAGRTQGSRNRSTLLREVADALVTVKGIDEKTDTSVTAEMAVAIALTKKAMAGDVAAIKELNDTLYGKIKDHTELTGASGSPLGFAFTVNHVKADPDQSS